MWEVLTAWTSVKRVGGVNGIAPLPLLTPAPASLQGARLIACTDTLAAVILSLVPNDLFYPSLPLTPSPHHLPPLPQPPTQLQGAMVIARPDTLGTAFWSSVPVAFFWPMLIIATLAVIVASQALITGCFSLVRQAITLGESNGCVHVGNWKSDCGEKHERLASYIGYWLCCNRPRLSKAEV